MNLRQMNWRTGALILCLALSLAISVGAYYVASQRQLPSWIEIQEGPVAHGIDKFYRNAYFKGNIEVAGDLEVAGVTDLSDTMTLTTAILDKLVWQDASGGVITSTRTLTPTATYYQVDPDAGGDITITLAACTTEGQPLILYNALTRTVTISSANALPAAPVALSQYDLYSAMCNGTGWVRSLTAVTGRNGETIINTPDGEWDFGSANLDTSGNIEGANLTASGNATIASNTIITGDLTVVGTTAVVTATAGTLTITTADITTAEVDKLAWQDASGGAITSTRTLTPTATYYQVDPDAGGDITITLAACTAEGQALILYNALTRTVTISSANALPAAPVALSQYDLYSAMCNGTAWVRSLTAVTGRNGETIINTPDGEWDFGSANLDTSGNIEGAGITASGNITGTNLIITDVVASGNIQGLTLAISGDADVGTWLNLSLQATIGITEGSTITPTGTYQVITSSLAVTTSTSTAIADGGETGDVLILQNGNAANGIVVDGTGANVECKVDVTLGANDILMLIWNGADWNCLTTYDNS